MYTLALIKHNHNIYLIYIYNIQYNLGNSNSVNYKVPAKYISFEYKYNGLTFPGPKLANSKSFYLHVYMFSRLFCMRVDVVIALIAIRVFS